MAVTIESDPPGYSELTMAVASVPHCLCQTASDIGQLKFGFIGALAIAYSAGRFRGRMVTVTAAGSLAVAVLPVHDLHRS